MVLGLKATSGVPKKPGGPSVGCKLQLVGEAGKPEAMIQIAESNGHREWMSMGKFTLPVPLDDKGTVSTRWLSVTSWPRGCSNGWSAPG